MCNYLCLLKNNFWQVPLPLISKMCTVMNFQNLKVHLKNFFEEELVEMENGKWKCPHIFYVEPSNEGFIIPLILYGLI